MKALMRFILWVALAAVAAAQPIRPWLNPGISDPRNLTGLAAWYDVSTTSSILGATGATITDGGAVALWGDKSGNSDTLCYVSGVAASNSVSATNETVTGNQSITLDVGLDDYSPAGDLTIVSKLSGNDGFAVQLLTTGVVRLRVGDGASVTNVDSTAAVTNTNYLRQSIGIAWTDGVGASFTLGGSPLGDPVAAVKTLTNAATSCRIGTITGRIYRVQVGSVYDFNPASTSTKKVANGDTITTGGDVWTLASSGATGARIAGERDLFQGTAESRPIYLGYSGTKYGYLNGTAGNYFSTPDSDASSGTGDISIRCAAQLSDWTPSVVQAFASKDGGGGTSNRGWYFAVTSTGLLRFQYSVDGTAVVTHNSSVPVSFANGSLGYVRADHSASTGVTTFYTSTDGVAWSLLATTAAGTTGNIYDTSANLSVGSNSAGNGDLMLGRVYSYELLFGGVKAVDFNPALYTSGTTFTASTGEVWTVNGGATIVTRPCVYFDGSNDYLKSAAFSYSQPESVYFVGSQVSWTAWDIIFDGAAATGPQVFQRTSTSRLAIYAGSTTAENSGLAVNVQAVVSAIFNGSASILRINRGLPTSGDAGLNNSNGITIGANGVASAGFSNITASELILRSAADAQATQDSFILYNQIKWQIW